MASLRQPFGGRSLRHDALKTKGNSAAAGHYPTKRPTSDRNWPPLGFRQWFGFVAVLTACIFAGTAYLLITVGSDPARLGRFIGSVVDGYQKRSDTPALSLAGGV